VILALGQINPTIGDCAGNARKILEAAVQAHKAGAGVVVFPELALTGYPPQDLLDSPVFVAEMASCLQALVAQLPPVVALVGFVERNPRHQGKPFHNAAALIRGGKIEAVYRKQLLPSYDVFDDERYFEPGDAPLVFEAGGLRFAVTICEDIWNHAGFAPRAYARDPLEGIGKVDWVLNLSASPFHLGKPALRRELATPICQKLGAGLALCNQVGANDDLIFDGSSFAVGCGGEAVAQGRSFTPDLVVWDTAHPVPAPLPPKPDAQWLAEALALGIRDYVHKSGAARVCLGLSGGVDSSVVAALAVRALGAEQVKGVLLPTRFTSGASGEDALALASALGISTQTFPIEDLFQQSLQTLTQGGVSPEGLIAENLQPRLRMALLMAVSNAEGSLLLNTSNKSELAAGYSTLYGDTAGALGVLGDLLKGQVYELAAWLNTQGAGIPQRVLDRPPSAELRPDQRDEDSLPPYALLDPMVRASVEAQAGLEALAGALPRAQAEQYLKLYRQSEYKRRQFPPVLRVSPRAFGRGRRIPLAARKPL